MKKGMKAVSVIALSVDIRQSTVWIDITKRKPDAETKQRLLSFNDDFITRVRKCAVDNKVRNLASNLRPAWQLDPKRMVTNGTSSNVLQLTASCFLTAEWGDVEVKNTGFLYWSYNDKVSYFVRASDQVLGRYTLEPLLESTV
jgi:hypothetical protein